MADIELIIKIPEEDWKFIKETDGCRWSRAILDGVINGVPLPKRMGKYDLLPPYDKQTVYDENRKRVE